MRLAPPVDVLDPAGARASLGRLFRFTEACIERGSRAGGVLEPRGRAPGSLHGAAFAAWHWRIPRRLVLTLPA